VAEALERRNAKLEGTLRAPETRELVERNRVLMDLRLAALNYPDLRPYTVAGTWAESDFRAWVKEQRIAGLDIEAACRAMDVAANASG